MITTVVMFEQEVSITSIGEEVWDFEAMDRNSKLLKEDITCSKKSITVESTYENFALIQHLVPSVVVGGSVEVFENGSANLFFSTNNSGRPTGFVKIRP